MEFYTGIRGWSIEYGCSVLGGRVVLIVYDVGYIDRGYIVSCNV